MQITAATAAPIPTISDAATGDIVVVPGLREIEVVRIERPTAGALRPRVLVEYKADWMAFGSQIAFVLADTPVTFLTPA